MANNGDVMFREIIGIDRDTDIESGISTLKYYLSGERIKFVLNGAVFSFGFFLLIIENFDEKMGNLFIEIKNEVPENFLLICHDLGYPVNLKEITEKEEISFQLSLKKNILRNEIIPQFSNSKEIDLEKLFSLRDKNTSQYYLTDLSFFEISYFS